MKFSKIDRFEWREERRGGDSRREEGGKEERLGENIQTQMFKHTIMYTII